MKSHWLLRPKPTRGTDLRQKRHSCELSGSTSSVLLRPDVTITMVAMTTPFTVRLAEP